MSTELITVEIISVSAMFFQVQSIFLHVRLSGLLVTSNCTFNKLLYIRHVLCKAFCCKKKRLLLICCCCFLYAGWAIKTGPFLRVDNFQ